MNLLANSEGPDQTVRADLGRRCPLYRTFSHGAAHVKTLIKRLKTSTFSH